MFRQAIAERDTGAAKVRGQGQTARFPGGSAERPQVRLEMAWGCFGALAGMSVAPTSRKYGKWCFLGFVFLFVCF